MTLMSPPAPATGAELLVQALADGHVNPGLARYIAKAISKMTAGLTIHGIAMLADPPGDGCRGVSVRESQLIGLIAARMGYRDALRTAERIIDGDAQGVLHRWRLVLARNAHVCTRCGRETTTTPDQEDLACPADAIGEALERRVKA